MNNILKIILMFSLILILTFIFTMIDSDLSMKRLNQFFVPMVFAINFCFSIFYHKIRRYLISISFGFLILMIIFYLAGQLNLSNWFGSLGFGSIIMIIASYLPELVTLGCIKKI